MAQNVRVIFTNKAEFRALLLHHAKQDAEQRWVDGLEQMLSSEDAAFVEELRPECWDIENEAGELKLKQTEGVRWMVQYGVMRHPCRVYKDQKLAVAFANHQMHLDSRVKVEPVRYVDGKEEPLPPRHSHSSSTMNGQ
jgi:hypothetical protein